MDNPTDSSRDRPPLVSLPEALMGHYMTGLLTIPVLMLAFWALDRWVVEVGHSLEEHTIAAFVGVLVTETVRTLVERPFVLKHDNPIPGDPVMAVLLVVAPWPCWGGFLWVMHGWSTWTWAATAVAGLVYMLMTVFLDEPWKEGDDPAEVARKWQETKDVTRGL